MVLFILPVTACKDGENTEDVAGVYTYSKFKYSVENDGIHITGYNGQESSVIFPKTIDGKDVVSIKSVSSKTLVNITLPSTVKRIESKAFVNCLALENINIAADDIIIADDAFAKVKSSQTPPQNNPAMASMSKPAKMSLTKTDDESEADDESYYTIPFSVSSEGTIENNAILNHNNTIVLNSVQKSMLQKFIDTGNLQKYRIIRTSSDSYSVLEVDGRYIYYDKKVNNQSVYNEVFTGNTSYIIKGAQKLKKESLPDLVFENARIK